MKKKTRKTQNNVAISNQSNQRESYLLELFLSLQELLLGSPAAAALGLGHYLAVAALLDELVHDLRAFGIVDAGARVNLRLHKKNSGLPTTLEQQHRSLESVCSAVN